MRSLCFQGFLSSRIPEYPTAQCYSVHTPTKASQSAKTTAAAVMARTAAAVTARTAAALFSPVAQYLTSGKTALVTQQKVM